MKIYIICVLAFVFGSMLTASLYFKGAYEKCKAQNENLKALIQNQNEAIRALEISTQEYLLQIKQKEQELKARYKSLKSDKELQSCEAKLNEIITALEIFKQGLVL